MEFQPLNLIDVVVYIGSVLFLLNRFSVKFAAMQDILQDLKKNQKEFFNRIGQCENDITRLDERTKPKGV